MATSTVFYRRRRGRKKTETTITEIPDHLLAEIFLRLPAEEDLARASAACLTFRRLITEGSLLPQFRRRFRRLQAPPLLGFLDEYREFHPAVPPYPSAPAARALALAADFSFSFLPSHCRWVVEDVRDSRVLLGRNHRGEDRGEPPIFRELVVCDPLHRRYVLLPSVPDALAASVELPPMIRRPLGEPFFAPLLGEEPAAAEFRVLCVVHCYFRLAVSVFVFSSSTGQWQAAASKRIGDLYHARGKLFEFSKLDPTFNRRHYAHGCFFWEATMLWRKELLVLDTHRMEFSLIDLPSEEWGTKGVAIVEAGEGCIGMFGIHGETRRGGGTLCYSTIRHDEEGESSRQWQMVTKIPLSSSCQYSIKAATERYLLLESNESPFSKGSYFKMADFKYISVDVKTFQLGSVCVDRDYSRNTFIYSDFPPSLLSSPTV